MAITLAVHSPVLILLRDVRAWGNFVFFFQAEDGIRDYKVTGVQTCALPISPYSPGNQDGSGGRGTRANSALTGPNQDCVSLRPRWGRRGDDVQRLRGTAHVPLGNAWKAGRVSCPWRVGQRAGLAALFVLFGSHGLQSVIA